jgi:predicted 2-oxoglutarate/Fe(II)-dependent dioxygenase YbiX
VKTEIYDFYSPGLANILWSRLSFSIPAKFGVFKPVRLSPEFRVNGFYPNIVRTPHVDFKLISNDRSEISLLSVVIYLNDDYTGGGLTVFKNTTNGNEEVFTLKPNIGTILIFPHDMLHRGDTCFRNKKYTMQTRVLFRSEGLPSEIQFN